MRTDRFEGLTVFLTVARQRSFRAAARELGVTPGAVSQSIRTLERRLGLPLFQRTTRHVALTEAGASLFTRLAPATAEIADALDALDGLRAHPSGLLRLTVPHMAGMLLVEPMLARLREEHPDVSVEISLDDSFVDLAERGFDAGIRIGEAVARDMVGVRLSPDLRWLVVGAPAYFAKHGHPETPQDLLNHECLRYRYPGGGGIYRWELVQDGHDIVVDVPGMITTNDGLFGLALARRGLGLAYSPDAHVANDIENGTLVTTLDDYSPTGAGFYLYFPAGAQAQPKLRAFVDTMRAVLKPPRARTRAALRRAGSSRGSRG